MTNKHPSFNMPDDNTIIWRYMDFTKLVSLLEKEALFFSTISILRESDQHEGTYNLATIEASKQQPFSIHDIGSDMLRTFGKHIAVNCWHMNEIESVAMWNVYLNNGPGVAIQSTVKLLNSNLNPDSNQQDFLIGKVHYLAEDEVIPEPDGFNALNAVIWKWKSYQYENELRAVIISRPEELYKYNGLYVPVNLNQLIQKIVISPKAPKWFSELIYSISEKYDLSKKVSNSRLDMSPGSLDQNKLDLEWTCPLCDTTQKTNIEPFIVKDYADNSTTVFSADRVFLRCENCEQSLIVPIRPQIEISHPDQSQDESK